MEGEQQAPVQVNVPTNSQRLDLDVCQHRYDIADLDEAEDALAQWKNRHRDFEPRDPVLCQLEQRVKDAIQVLKDINQLLQDVD
jgi:hypothetical protein